MAAMEKHQSNAMVLDQVVEEGLNKTGGVESNPVVVDQVMEEAMGQPGKFTPNCRGDPFQGHFYGDTYQIKGQTALVHEFNVDEFN